MKGIKPEIYSYETNGYSNYTPRIFSPYRYITFARSFSLSSAPSFQFSLIFLRILFPLFFSLQPNTHTHSLFFFFFLYKWNSGRVWATRSRRRYLNGETSSCPIRSSRRSWSLLSPRVASRGRASAPGSTPATLRKSAPETACPRRRSISKPCSRTSSRNSTPSS